MKAIILAAGAGSRMGPLTKQRPKPLLTVAGKTILERMLEGLERAGVRSICIVVGYLEDQIRCCVAEGFPHLDIQCVTNPRHASTNNIYSLKLAFDAMDVDEDVLILEADLLFDPTVIPGLVASAEANVALVDDFDHSMDGTVVSASGGVVTGFIPPHLQGPGFDYSGKLKTVNAYKLSAAFVTGKFAPLLSYYAETFDETCYYELILGILVYMRQDQIHCRNIKGARWIEVDNPSDLERAEAMFASDAGLGIVERSFGGYWQGSFLDFAYIRNMHFPTAPMIEAIRDRLPELMKSYGSSQDVLDEKMSRFAELPRERVCALNGASQIYPLLAERLAGRRVAIPEPSFGEYARCLPGAVRYRDGLLSGRSVLEDPALDHADVVVVVNPNNPTGSVIASEQIHAFAEARPGTLVIVDESFIDFADARPVQDLIAARPLANVWIIKSLSKALGVPGVRLGYLHAPPEEAAWFRSRLPIWNMNSLAEFVLELAIRERRALGESFRRTMADRQELADLLANVEGVSEVCPSGADFLPVRLDIDPACAKALREMLFARYDILVRDVSDKMADSGCWLRVAVRLPEENRRFAVSLEAALAGCRSPRVVPLRRPGRSSRG
jgi:histidinol-phosphate/aromatic aminotransferase/cobyric acid decarboxylase-like protein/choline kinase